MEIDLTPTPTSTKSPDDTEIDTPPYSIKPLSYANGALKNHHRHQIHPPPLPLPPPPIVVAYKECMKNHAAAIGGHAVDGCGEFMPSPSSAAADPTSLTCAACGCHRNFHRRDPESPTSAAITPPFLDFRHPPLPKRFSPSPSPPSQSPPRPHAFFAAAAEDHHPAPVTPTVENTGCRKRFRTRFSQDQKVKMLSFSMKLGWKMQKCDEAAVKEFCHEIGVPKGVLKVWMHNNKNTYTKKETSGGGGGITNDSVISFDHSSGGSGSGDGGVGDERKIGNHSKNENGNGKGVHFHGFSSSSPA